ncbi:MAG: hypothetical protein QNK32_04490 [Porticoccus sp.]|nr:hypothetical protein [Porticoccus sp.]
MVSAAVFCLVGCSNESQKNRIKGIVYMPYYSKCDNFLEDISSQNKVSIKKYQFIDLGEIHPDQHPSGFISLSGQKGVDISSVVNRISHNCFPIEFIETDTSLLGFRAIRERALMKANGKSFYTLQIDKSEDVVRLYHN